MSIMNVGLSGLRAASADLEVTGNNIANANTNGFKQSRVQFSDVYSANGGSNQLGNGVNIATIDQDFKTGSPQTTGGVLDMAIVNDGFFTLKDVDGSTVYSRAGHFGWDDEGFIVNAQGARLQAYLPENGTIGISMGDLQLPTDLVPAKATSKITYPKNFDASQPIISETFDANDASTYNSSKATTIYDSLGAQHSLSSYFVKTADNNWAVHVEVDGTSIGSGSLVFDTSGQLQSSTGLGSLSWNPGGGAAPGQTLNLDFSQVTQFGADSPTTQPVQDGYAAGNFNKQISIDTDGVISASYTNGRVEPLGQVAIATFNNPRGLLSTGNTMWLETADSGEATVSKNNNAGNIKGGSLENSNVDITEQLVNMINAQRFFQANAQSIKAGDTLIQTVINIT